MTTQAQKDNGLITVLYNRYKHQRLPRTLALKEKVERGETLDDFDTSFLMDVLNGVSDVMPIMERHPECRKLATDMVNLCCEISEKGLENEKKV